MKFKQAYAAIESLVKSQPTLFSNATIEFFFGENNAPIGDWTNPDNIGILVAGDGIGSKSGMYFFGSPEGEIIYNWKSNQGQLASSSMGSRQDAEGHARREENIP